MDRENYLSQTGVTACGNQSRILRVQQTIELNPHEGQYRLESTHVRIHRAQSLAGLVRNGLMPLQTRTVKLIPL